MLYLSWNYWLCSIYKVVPKWHLKSTVVSLKIFNHYNTIFIFYSKLGQKISSNCWSKKIQICIQSRILDFRLKSWGILIVWNTEWMDLSPVVIVKARVNTISRVLSDKWNFFHFETREFNQLQPTHPGTLNSLEVGC